MLTHVFFQLGARSLASPPTPPVGGVFLPALGSAQGGQLGRALRSPAHQPAHCAPSRLRPSAYARGFVPPAFGTNCPDGAIAPLVSQCRLRARLRGIMGAVPRSLCQPFTGCGRLSITVANLSGRWLRINSVSTRQAQPARLCRICLVIVIIISNFGTCYNVQ